MFTRVMRSTWTVLTWIFLVAIPVQFYLAGLGAFHAFKSDPWNAHAAWGTLMGLLALLMLLVALAARLPRRLLGFTALLFVLMVIQFILGGLGDSAKGVAALHPVNALLIIGVAIMLVFRSRIYSPVARFRPSEQAAVEPAPASP